MVEEEKHGVREGFAQQPARQMPHVACPHPLYGVTLHELRKDGVDPVAKTAQQSAPSRSGIFFLGGVGSQKRDRHARQLFLGFGRVVVAVPDDDPGGKLGKFWKHGELMCVGRSYRQAGNETRPAHAHMHPEAVEGLLEQSIFAESGLSSKAAAAVGASEKARRQRHRVNEREGGIVRGEEEQILPEVFLYLPEVSRLAGEGGTVDLAEGWEPLAVVAPKEEVDVLVG